MNKFSLTSKSRDLLQKASALPNGRTAETIYGGHEKRLRQTVVALQAGAKMAEHESPGHATLLVISGRLWLVAGETRWFGREWDYLLIPSAAHSVEAETDAAFILTVATRD